MSILLRVLAVFPLPILHAMGTVVGWLVYLGSHRFRKHLRENLEAAGYNDPVIRRSAVAEAGKGAMELPAIWMRSQEEAARLVVEVHGWDLIERALAAGKGAILLTPHLGCWEITAQYASRRHPITVLYSPPKMQAVEPLMQHGRTREGMRSVPPDLSGLRAMLRALHKGEAIGILPDQVPGIGEGEWTEFFGRPAYTMTLVTRLAQNSRAAAATGCMSCPCPIPCRAKRRSAASTAPSRDWCAAARPNTCGPTTATRFPPGSSRRNSVRRAERGVRSKENDGC